MCVTLYDWRTFPQQFAKTRDPDEKVLYRILNDQVGPTVIEALVVCFCLSLGHCHAQVVRRSKSKTASSRKLSSTASGLHGLRRESSSERNSFCTSKRTGRWKSGWSDRDVRKRERRVRRRR